MESVSCVQPLDADTCANLVAELQATAQAKHAGKTLTTSES